jgi:hypothetical protein
METGTLKKKIDLLSVEQQLKLERVIDEMLHSGNINAPKQFPVTKNESVSDFEIKPGFGGGKGIFGYMADDFDEPLDDFKDYM